MFAATTAVELFGGRLPMCEHRSLTDSTSDRALRPVPDPPATDARLAELVDEFARPAFRVAVAIVRDAALAEDVVQETMVKVWRSLDTWRGEGSMRAWVLRIAHNTAVSTLRRLKDVPTDPSVIPEVAVAVTTEQVASGRLAVDVLAEELAQLDPLSRSIVVLREIDGMRYDEIAEALEVPVSMVKTRLFRARRHLTTRLAEWA